MNLRSLPLKSWSPDPLLDPLPLEWPMLPEPEPPKIDDAHRDPDCWPSATASLGAEVIVLVMPEPFGAPLRGDIVVPLPDPVIRCIPSSMRWRLADGIHN